MIGIGEINAHNPQNRTSSVATVFAGERTAVDAWQFSTAQRTVVYGLFLPKPAKRHVANHGASLLR